MKRRVILFALFWAVVCYAQQPIPQAEVATDSLNPYQVPVTDSLETIETETVFQDSISNEATFQDSAVVDTIHYNMTEINANLLKHLAKKENLRKNLQLPILLNSENFHLRTPFNPALNLTKNGFTIIPFHTSTIQLIQNFQPFYNTTYNLGFVDFENDNYDLPVAVTEAFLGLGDIEMNMASASFKKDDILDVRNLGLELAYLGQDGTWIGKRERSANMDVHLFYNLGKFTLHGYNTTIDQKIGTNKLALPPELNNIEEIKDKLSENALVLENPYLTLGLKTEKTNVDTLERKLSTILLNKEIAYSNFNFAASFEYFRNHTESASNARIVLSQKANIFHLKWDYNISYEDYEQYYIASELAYFPVKWIGLFSQIQKIGDDTTNNLWQKQRLGGGLIWQNSYLKYKVTAGKDDIDDNAELFTESSFQADFTLGRLSLKPANWSLYRDTDNLEIPMLQTQTDFELSLNMEHANAIFLILQHVYISEYGYLTDFSESYIFNSFQNLNCSLGLQITKRFKIKVDAINLLGTEQLFGFPTSEVLEGMHFNFNLQWIFIN